MNLQESIRRILREEKIIPVYLKRRLVTDADIYIQELDPKDVCRYWSDDESKEYVSGSMAEIVREMLYYMPNVDPDEYGEMYDEAYGVLIDLGYPEKLRNFFYDSLKNCEQRDRMRFMKP